MAERLLKIALVLGLLAFVFLLFFRPIETEDIWWHLATGKWVVAHGQVPHQDLFPSFTEVVRPWVFTQWLGSLILYGVTRAAGLAGLKFFRSILFVVIIGIFLVDGRKRMPLSLIVPVAFLMALNLQGRFVIRPCIFNMIFSQLFLIGLFAYQKSGRQRFLLFLPLMGMVWSQMNMGAFIYGNLLILIFLMAEIPRALDARIRPGVFDRALSGRRVKDLALCLAGYVAVFLINPYGWPGFLYPFRVLFQPDFIHFYIFNNIITEMQSPFVHYSVVGNAALTLFIVLDVTALALLVFHDRSLAPAQGTGERREASRADGTASGAALVLSCFFLFVFAVGLLFYGMRGIIFFSVTSPYIMTRCAERISLKRRWAALPFGRLPDLALSVFMMGVLVYHIVPVANARIVVGGRLQSVLPLIHYPGTPDREVKFLRAHHITGPILHDDTTGGFLIWASYPELKPFIDGRQLNYPYFRKYTFLITNPGKFWPKAEREFGFTIALMDASRNNQLRILKFLRQLPDWQIIYLRGSNVIMVKKGVFDFPEDVDRMEGEFRSRTFSAADAQRLKDLASRVPVRKAVERWRHPSPFYIQALEEGITLYDLGFKEAGMNYITRAVEAFPCTMTAAVARTALMKFEKDGP